MNEQTKQFMIAEHIKKFGVTKCPSRICDSSWINPGNRESAMKSIKNYDTNTDLITLPSKPTAADMASSDTYGKSAGTTAPSRVHSDLDVIQEWMRS